MPNLLPQAKLLRRSIAFSPKTTNQQFGSRRRCTHFFNSKDIRNQTSEVPSSFPRGPSITNQKWGLWTLEWIYEGLRNTTHWEQNPSMWEKRTILPKFFLFFCFEGWDSEWRQKLQEWNQIQCKNWVEVSGTTDVSAWQQLFCRVPVTIPAKCHSRIRPFCDRTALISELFPYWPWYHHSRWFRKSEISGSHGVKSLMEAW